VISFHLGAFHFIEIGVKNTFSQEGGSSTWWWLVLDKKALFSPMGVWTENCKQSLSLDWAGDSKRGHPSSFKVLFYGCLPICKAPFMVIKQLWPHK